MQPLILCMFLASIAALKAPRSSIAVLDLLTYYNGHWENKAQIKQGGQDHDFVEAWVTPVDVPALRPNPVVLIEEANNGVVHILNLGVVSDGPEKNSVIIKLYNFTDITQLKPRKLDVQILNNLTLEDLHSGEDCFAMFDVVERRLVYGNYADCSYTVNGSHPRFSLTFTCNTAAVSLPQGTSLKSPIGPYMFPNLGPRNPLINPPEDYVSPCN